MANRINLDNFGILGILAGLGGLAYAAYQSNKMSKVAQKIDMTIDDVERKANVDVEKSIIDAAIEKAVNRKVDKAATEAVNAIKADMHSTISSKVRKEVDSQFTKISEEVTEKISEQVEAISEDKLVSQVLPRVEKRLTEKGEVTINRVESEMRAKLSKSMDFIGATTDVIKNAAFGRNSGSGGRSINLNLD